MIDTVKDNRLSFIGGSDIPTLLGYSQFKTREELIEQYKNKLSNNIPSEYTEYGNLMEEKIRKYINEKYNIDANPRCRTYENKKIRCNTDGYDVKNNLILEIKTNSGNHNNTFDYELQMQLYMWAFKCDKGLLVQYKRPKNFYTGIVFSIHNGKEYFNLDFDPSNITVKEIKRNDEIIEHILNEIEKFWKEIN